MTPPRSRLSAPDHATVTVHAVVRATWVSIRQVTPPRKSAKKAGPNDYLVHVSKRDQRPQGLLYPIRLQRRLPIIPIPLKPNDPDARLDLQAVLDAAYENANYDLEIDYRREPNPPLTGKHAEWSDQLLRDKGLR
jgi:hypothetical protein